MRSTNAALRHWSFLAAVSLGFLLAAQARTATMTAETLRAWNECEQQARAEVLKQAGTPDDFLSVRRRTGHLDSVQFQGGLSIYAPHGGAVPVPSGLIHHWVGTVFIPKAHVTELLAVLQDYDSYAAIYKPGVVESRLLSRDQDEFTYRLKFVQKGFGIRAGLLADFKSSYYRLTPDVGYSITEATRLTELGDPGMPQERPLTQRAAHGYVEKVFTIVRYRQADAGLYVEVESFTLSRDIPAAIRWIATPLVQRFSRQTMADTLERLGDRVFNTAPLVEAAASNALGGSAGSAQ